MFLRQHEDETDLIHIFVFKKLGVALTDNLVVFIDSDDGKSMHQIVTWYRLEPENIKAVENGLKVFFLEELVCQLVDIFIVRVFSFEVDSLQSL